MKEKIYKAILEKDWVTLDEQLDKLAKFDIAWHFLNQVRKDDLYPGRDESFKNGINYALQKWEKVMQDYKL